MKKSLSYFSRSTEQDKYQGTICKGPQSILTITVELIRSILQDLRGSWKHRFLEQKANFPVKKKFGLYFLVFSSVKNLGVQKIGVQSVFQHLLWKLSDHFFGPKMSIETNIPKNLCFHWDNRFWSVFRRIIEGEKPQAALYRGPQATLTLTVEVVRWFL